MAITHEELASRIRRARKAAGLTQEDVARALGLSRSAVALIEAGRRRVDSVELARIARALGRSAAEFLAPQFEQNGVALVMRALAEAMREPDVRERLADALEIARQIVSLEALLGIERLKIALPRYRPETPRGRWQAVRQGMRIAVEERQRLGLGTDPIGDVAAVLERQGVLVLEVELPEAISGFTFRFDGHLACAVNAHHHWSRQRFSLAHEMCHALCDVDAVPGIVSRSEETGNLREVRANAFAADFLMPEEGVRAFLEGLGKGLPSAMATERGTVRRRQRAGAIDLWDVAELANHFGVSGEAAIWRLHALRLIDEGERAALAERLKLGLGPRLEKRFGLQEPQSPRGQVRYARRRLFSLAREALRRGEISRRKFTELAALAGLTEEEIDEALQRTGSMDR